MGAVSVVIAILIKISKKLWHQLTIYIIVLIFHTTYWISPVQQAFYLNKEPNQTIEYFWHFYISNEVCFGDRPVKVYGNGNQMQNGRRTAKHNKRNPHVINLGLEIDGHH